ncbi:DNA repair nuclease [Aureococcus anophagefferens]|uniref:DNA repair nuclease n=1 Tax=Aureococcus anophagefferens TaxID=44056 RepID=A0ABR1G4W1_AURAN
MALRLANGAQGAMDRDAPGAFARQADCCGDRPAEECSRWVARIDAALASTWLYPTNYPVRAYQESIVKQCLLKNTLVCLPTGLGKTLIAAVLMYNYHRWFPEGQIIFMAPTRPLVGQQVAACHGVVGLPEGDTAEINGTVDQRRRRQLWAQRRVFYCTPQTVQNDLENGALDCSRVVLVVVDEAHRALKKYAYCGVVRAIAKRQSHFRVLALSATPGSDIAGVQAVIDNLRIAHVETIAGPPLGRLKAARLLHSSDLAQLSAFQVFSAECSRPRAAGQGGASGMKQDDQKAAVKRFLADDTNVLVATCIAEEGLDIGGRHVGSPIRLVQRMGRTARKRAGRVVLLMGPGEDRKFEAGGEKSAASTRPARFKGARLHQNLNKRMVPRRLVPNWPDRVDRELAIGAYHASQVGGNSAKAKRKRQVQPAAEYKGDAALARLPALHEIRRAADLQAAPRRRLAAERAPRGRQGAEEAAPPGDASRTGRRRGGADPWGFDDSPAPAPPPRPEAPAPPRPPAPAAPPAAAGARPPRRAAGRTPQRRRRGGAGGDAAPRAAGAAPRAAAARAVAGGRALGLVAGGRAGAAASARAVGFVSSPRARAAAAPAPAPRGRRRRRRRAAGRPCRR